MINGHSNITEHRALWNACVDSGFTESRWWPQSGLGTPLAWVDRDGIGSWFWTQSHEQRAATEVGWAAGPNAILAGLVEWATDGGRGIDSLFRYSTPTEHTKCKAEVHSHNRGDGTCPTTALLACFKSWRAAQ